MADLRGGLLERAIGSLGVDRSESGGVREWLKAGVYQLKAAQGTAFTLERFDAQEYLRYLSHDFERFVLACAETLYIARAEYRSDAVFPWTLLKLYYSAFYGSHAIMRSAGQGVVKLDSAEANALSQFISASQGTTTQINAGFYKFELVQSSTGYEVEFTLPQNAGGVHEAHWKEFRAYLDNTASLLASTSAASANDFISGMAEVVPHFQQHPQTGGVWLSAIRNMVNYQQAFHLWSPKPKNKSVSERLDAVTDGGSSVIRLDKPMWPDPIPQFTLVTNYLAVLAKEVAEFHAARSTKAQAFGFRWRRLLSTVTFR